MNINQGSPLFGVKMAAASHRFTLFRYCLTSRTGFNSTLPTRSPIHAFQAPQVFSRSFADARMTNLTSVPPTDGATVPPSVAQDLVRHDRYIPITRRHLVRSLMEETNLLTGTERDNFARFAASLDAHLYQKYYEHLDKMKVSMRLCVGIYTTVR